MGKRGERERERAEDALFDGIGSSFSSFLYGADDRREQRAEMRKRNEIKIYKKKGEYERNKNEREKKEAIATHHSILNRSHLDGRSHHPPGIQRRGRNWGGKRKREKKKLFNTGKIVVASTPSDLVIGTR